MLFTREKLIEMGIIKDEPLKKSEQFEVATSGLPGCQVVARSNQQVATDLSLYIIYTYFSRLLGCQNIYTLVEIYINSKDENAILPSNSGNRPLADYLLSLWETYDLQLFLEVATGCQVIHSGNLEKAIEVTNSSNLADIIRADYRFYKRFGHPPGDAWDGVLPDDHLDLDQFGATEARLIPDREVLESAAIERQRVRPGTTMLSLMYPNNIKEWTWFEGTDGQWHCYNNGGLND